MYIIYTHIVFFLLLLNRSATRSTDGQYFQRMVCINISSGTHLCKNLDKHTNYNQIEYQYILEDDQSAKDS